MSDETERIDAPKELIDRMKNAVAELQKHAPFWTFQYLLRRALQMGLDSVEIYNGGPFPERTGDLRNGRPKKNSETPGVLERRIQLVSDEE